VREARNLRTALRNGKALADWTNETGAAYIGISPPLFRSRSVAKTAAAFGASLRQVIGCVAHTRAFRGV